MSNDIFVQQGIIIPEYELEVNTSRSGGAGGQHVNKTETRVTIRWNVKQTHALDEQQKVRVLQNLAHKLTADGDLIVHNSSSRSQQQNKENALSQLAQEIRKALYVPKKRMKTKVSKSTKEARLESKKRHSNVKKMRRKSFDYD